MEGYDWDKLRREVCEIRENTVNPRSRTTYLNSYSRFIAWAALSKKSYVSAAFIEKIGGVQDKTEQQVRARVKEKIAHDRTTPPLDFANLQAQDFVMWLVTLKRRDGCPLSYSAFNTHRAALFNLYRDFEFTMTKTLESELTNHFKGLKNKLAKDVGNGIGDVKTGKDPLMFDLYAFLCEKMLAHPAKEMTFSHTYMVIAWNLMCRSSNAFGIRHSHMEWRGDALQIYFAHMKDDQGGDRPRDPRHVYANPLRPEICPILALGIFWSCTDFDGTDLLFPGNNQYERFRKSLQRILTQEDVVAELSRQGLKATELGTHSMRKGAATFCSSGSTACPSSTAVHLRAGWSLRGVQNTYLRYEAAGDMHVGRTVAGLPTESAQFSILAPHFEYHEKCVKTGVQLMFPGIPERLEFVAEYCLASLVYHYSYLKKTLPPEHQLFECPLFQDPELQLQLFERVKTGDGSGNSRIRPTGIPPHVSVLCEMKWLKQSLVEALSKIESTRVETVKDIVGELEARAIGAGTVTYDGLNDAIRSCLQETGVNDLVQRLTSPVQQTPDVTTDIQDNERMLTHFWGGQFRRVPADFQVPDCSTRQVWILWRCGNKVKQWPPFRLLDGRDMPDRKQQRRLSDLRFVMKKLERDAASKNLLQRSQSIEDVTNVYLACADSVAVESRTERSRKRRRGQLSWSTIAKLRRRRSEACEYTL